MADDFTIEIHRYIRVTSEDIDDIMATALEGGITHWCNKATVVGEYLGEFASEQISRGGTLKLHDAEDDVDYELTLYKLLNGIREAIERDDYAHYGWFNKNELDTCMIDADVADLIIQLAIFGDVIYG